jgi:hypothetical protein
VSPEFFLARPNRFSATLHGNPDQPTLIYSLAVAFLVSFLFFLSLFLHLPIRPPLPSTPTRISSIDALFHHQTSPTPPHNNFIMTGRKYSFIPVAYSPFGRRRRRATGRGQVVYVAYCKHPTTLRHRPIGRDHLTPPQHFYTPTTIPILSFHFQFSPPLFIPTP